MRRAIDPRFLGVPSSQPTSRRRLAGFNRWVGRRPRRGRSVGGRSDSEGLRSRGPSVCAGWSTELVVAKMVGHACARIAGLELIELVLTACEPRSIDADVRNPCRSSVRVATTLSPSPPAPTLQASGWNDSTVTSIPPNAAAVIRRAFAVIDDQPVQYMLVQVGEQPPTVISVRVAGADPEKPLPVDIPTAACG